MAASEATVVLVHGAGSGAWIWQALGQELDARGVAHLEVDLPTVGVGVDPTLDSHADAAYVRSLLDARDGPVVLCGNSYGGVVITEAAAGQPDVARLVYLAAFMPDADDELSGFMAGNSNPEFLAGTVIRDDGLVEFDVDLTKVLVFQQCSAEVTAWATSQMRPMAMNIAATHVAAVAWHDIASTYVVCSEDRSIQPEAQRRWATERATDMVEVPFDHCPQVSHPAEVADLLATVVGSLAV